MTEKGFVTASAEATGVWNVLVEWLRNEFPQRSDVVKEMVFVMENFGLDAFGKRYRESIRRRREDTRKEAVEKLAIVKERAAAARSSTSIGGTDPSSCYG